MHELGVTMEIVEAVEERAAGRAVRRVRLAIGELAAIAPDAVRFCFEVCAKDTAVEGAELVIERVAGQARCRGCDARFELHVPYGACACGGVDLEWLAGFELRVLEMEIV